MLGDFFSFSNLININEVSINLICFIFIFILIYIYKLIKVVNNVMNEKEK